MPARVLASLLLCLLVHPVAAQSAGDTKAAEEKEIDDEAMLRARRQAASPMRWILEASRQPRRVVAPAPVDAASASAPPARQTRAPAVTEPAIRVTVEPLRTGPDPLPQAPAAVEVRDPAPPQAAAAPGTPSVAATVERLLLPPPVGLTMASPTAILPAPVPVVVIEPKLLQMVEPAMPPSVLAELGRGIEVTAELSLRVDGTVDDVRLLSRTSRNLQRVLLAALLQWRFEPLARPTLHRVQLVFNH